MVKSLEALRAFDFAVTQATGNDGHATRRSELLEDAAEHVHFVVIQREALKLSSTEEFLEYYGVPAEVRARLGQRRRK
jgi:hypothetical protein